MKARVWCIPLILCAALMAAGCKTHPPAPIPPDFSDSTSATTPTGSDAGGTALSDVPPDTPFASWPELKKVHFDYNSAVLRPDAIAVMKANAEAIKQSPNVLVRVEGHCDERGTQEYNMALGERRSLAVREYLIRVGVPGSRIITLSHGKERPADPGHAESAWRLNRRCEFSKSAGK